ncbi:MAG: DNA-3-methyladenine glycosylase [Haloarculaceae archaeon]
MDAGVIDVAALSGGFDLQSTIESGQSYLWDRADGRTYEDPTAYGGDAWYHTVLPAAETETNAPEAVRVRQVDGRLEWEASVDADPHLRRRLRLDDDLAAVRVAAPDDPLVERAYEAARGMRLVRDPPFATLISFICSAQMRVERIHGMQVRLRETFGTPVSFDGETYHAYPAPEALASATEADLRDLALGYRAPYVQRSAELVATGEAHPAEAADRDYEAAREWLTRFVGVGDKVADCVLLFSLGYLEAIPLDTWIRSAIEEYYPDCERGSYAATSRALRERFGGEYAGYVQTYVFHYLRGGGE